MDDVLGSRERWVASGGREGGGSGGAREGGRSTAVRDGEDRNFTYFLIRHRY
jgi:hypothetical protein